MKLDRKFFERDALVVGPELLGKKLCWRNEKGEERSLAITEVEVYRGEEDKACHASRGKTERNKVMYLSGGVVYVYLIYGIYWLINIVTGSEGDPQAVLIRGLEGVRGPGRVGREMGLDKSFYGEDVVDGGRVWICEGEKTRDYKKMPRVGVDYSGEWAKKLWRFEVQ